MIFWAWDTLAPARLFDPVETALGEARTVDVLGVGRGRLEVGMRQARRNLVDRCAGFGEFMGRALADPVLRARRLHLGLLIFTQN